MASSDDECESVPHSVSDYDFVDDNDEPISFSELPVQWGDGERTGGNKEQIFIHGNIDNGLQKIYKQVTVWKFDLSEANPDILVLMSKENQWMKLQKPRKSFEDTIRTILITLHSLHFLRKYPEISGRALWDHLSKVFRYEPRPSENDLVDHMNLICEAVKKDEVISKSKFIVTFLDEKPRKRKAEDVKITENSEFIVDDMIDETEEDESDDEEQGDKVCAICDNGGDILCCEGKCLRSFHATIEAGSESACESLGFSDEQVEAIQNYYCKNCQYKRHQCYACGELGSSDETASAIEVFRCVSGECGRFYHPRCVSKLLHPDSESHAEELEKKINNGASFTCPFHKCCVCKQTETEQHPDLRFAMCRRCPKSYHRKCLPTEICFDDPEDVDIIPRAWEKLMPKKRILIYCLEHEIDDDLLTPIRNHIKFPGEEKKKKQASEMQSRKETVILKKKSLVLEDASRMKTYVKPPITRDKLSVTIKRGNFPKKSDGIVIGKDSSKKHKLMDISRKPLSKTSSKFKSSPDENKTSLGNRLYALVSKGSEPIKPRKNDAADGEHDQTYAVKSVAKETSNLPPLDAVSEKRILALMKDATSSITLAEINEKHKVPTTHAYSSKNSVDKTITLGKVEGSVEALRAAVQKLEEGCSIEDAKAVCGPGLLSEMMKWKNKLRVYLAPFLHGMRYTSFGRHFTKLDKLKKVVDILHWYAQDGDMIVDFCCGANDFSCLMKKRLDEVGKKCYYKNFDVIQPKNDFNFEQRDWMSVQPNELPPGSRLIMGLNPPFGVKASLANKFINKALEFKPKLLVLIVPQETERLDKKNPPYDLVFEDNELLAGKSFYLPGSVDINDKQMDQWNMSPPPLSFWSHQDWTSKHKAIAQQHGDLHRGREVSHMVDNQKEINVPVSPVEDNKLNLESSTLLDSHTLRNGEPIQLQERATTVVESHKEGLPHDNGGSERPENNDGVSERPENNDGDNNRSYGDPKKRNRRKGKQRKGSSEILLEDQQKSKISQPSKSQGVETPSFKGKILPEYKQKSKSCQPSKSQGVETPSFKSKILPEDKQKSKSSQPSQSQGVETPSFNGKQRRGSSEISTEDNQKRKSFLPSQSQAVETPSLTGVGNESYQHFDGRVSEPHHLGAGYTGKRLRGSREMSPVDYQKSYMPSQSQAVETPSFVAAVGNGSYLGRVSESHWFGGYTGKRLRGSSEISPEDYQKSFLPSQSLPVETPALTGVGNESYQPFDGRISELHQLGAGYTGKGRRGSSEILSEDYQKSFLPSQSQAVETPSLAGVGNETYQQFDGSISGSYQFRAAGTWEDEMAARRYVSVSGEPYQSSTNRNRFSEEQISGYHQREIVENRGYMYDLPSQRSSYLDGHNPRVPTPYGNLGGSVPDPSYSTSTMQRYAPRLDELNYSRMNSLRSEPPRSGVYDPLAPPRPLYQGQGFPPGQYFQ